MFLRTSGLDASDAYVIDELTFGTTYSSVVETPPFALTVELDIGEAGNTSMALRWPASTAATLQSSNVLDAGSWTSVPGPFALDAIYNHWQVPESPKSRDFFRLWRREENVPGC